MKTIAQIASEIGVSKQAVMYRLKKLEATNKNDVLAVKENGVLAVSLAGETLIKSAFSENNRQNNSDKQTTNKRQTENDILTVLQSTINTLQGQLVVKDKQIAELNSRLAESHTALVAAQSLHGGTIQHQLSSDNKEKPEPIEVVPSSELEPQKKPNFFTRLFRKD